MNPNPIRSVIGIDTMGRIGYRMNQRRTQPHNRMRVGNMTTIDTETIATEAGSYRIEFMIDDCAEAPEDEGFGLFLETRFAGVDLGDAPAGVTRAIRDRDRSGMSIVRYMSMLGHNGVTLVSDDYHPVTATSDRAEDVVGVAWAPADVPAATADQYVASRLSEWRAWAHGDVFGYSIIGPDGQDVDSMWGYYGYADSVDYVMSEVRATVTSDAAERVRASQLVGSGFVGLI